jgi:DNA (cytosine-5)-methyltransferase 1
MKAFGVFLKKIGMHRARPRLFAQGKRLEFAGLMAGTRFAIENVKSGGIRLLPSEEGDYTVSRKEIGASIIPVVDLNSTDALRDLSNESVVRLVIREDGVYVLPLASEVAKRERIERLQAKLEQGEVSTASLAHGGGVLTNAAHLGIQDAGLQPKLAMLCEIEENYALQSMAYNPSVSSDTFAAVMPMQELAMDSYAMSQLPKVELLEMGLPCSGASVAGVSKRKLSMMEDHPEVGHLVHAALCLIQKLQPAVIVLENVEGYAKSASAQILRHQLRDMGYSISEHVLSARDFGCLENRVRWALVALTDGLGPMPAVSPVTVQKAVLGDLLEPVADDDPRWSKMDYLVAKEKRDQDAGKGFAMQTVDATSQTVPVIRKHYNKGGSTDPYVRHPNVEGLLRKFTPNEVAKIKGVDPALIEGMSATSAIELLGQSVVVQPFRSLFKQIGEVMKASTGAMSLPVMGMRPCIAG